MNATKENMDKQKDKKIQENAEAGVCWEKDQVRQRKGQNKRKMLK